MSKEYTPVHRRYSFFNKYNAEYIDKLIPSSLSLLKEKIVELLKTLEGLDRNHGSFGMIHFDYNDGNYSIDFDTGQITVYDFGNSCFGWYMYGEQIVDAFEVMRNNGEEPGVMRSCHIALNACKAIFRI